MPGFVTLFCTEPRGTDTASWPGRGQELPKRDWIEDACVQSLQVTEKQPGVLWQALHIQRMLSQGFMHITGL